MSKLLAALLLSVVVLTGCSSLGEFGDVVPTEAFYAVTVRAEGPGRVTLEQFQVDCSDTCTLDIPVGVVVQPQPVADDGARFWYWGGACSGAGDCSALVDSDLEIVAVFEEGDGGPVTPGGDDTGGTGDDTGGTDDGGSDGQDDTGGSGDDTGGTDGQDDSGGTDDDTGGTGGQDDSGGTGDDTGGTGDDTGGTDDGGTGDDTGGNDDQDDTGGDDSDEGPGLDGHYFLTFGLTGSGSGVIEIAARDFVCTGECGLNGLPGEKVELEAIADEGSFFAGWTGACEGSGESCTVTMDEDDVTMAQFRLDDKPLLLLVDPVPDGGTIRGGDIDCGDDSDACASDHASGESIELRAEAASQFEFAGWTGVCADNESTTCEFIIEGDTTVSADFEGREPMHELTVNVDGNANGEVIFPDGARCDMYDTCDQHYPEGTEVTLAAIPIGGGYVDGWEGTDCDTNAETCTIRMDADRTITVSFHTSDLEFILRIEEPTGGTIVSRRLEMRCGDEGDNCHRDAAFDDEIRLEAIPSEGFDFVEWGGDCSQNRTPVCDLVFRDSKDVSATFQPE